MYVFSLRMQKKKLETAIAIALYGSSQLVFEVTSSFLATHLPQHRIHPPYEKHIKYVYEKVMKEEAAMATSYISSQRAVLAVTNQTSQACIKWIVSG